MGTRGLVKVIDSEGVLRVAQYGQYDHYPSGQGAIILNFLNEYGVVKSLKDSLTKCKFISPLEMSRLLDAYNDDPKFDGIRDEPEAFTIAYPSLSRMLGGDVLKSIVYSNNEVLLMDDSEFENDGTFCEGVYTIDYSTNQFITRWQYDQGKAATSIWNLDELPTVETYLAMVDTLTKQP